MAVEHVCAMLLANALIGSSMRRSIVLHHLFWNMWQERRSLGVSLQILSAGLNCEG